MILPRLALALSLLSAAALGAAETVTFPASDGVVVTAELYLALPPTAPFVILCHQANWSRGEYKDIAPRLNKLGFNALAIDQRSGGRINGVENETVKSARAAEATTGYIYALPDIVAAVSWARAHGAGGKLLLLGSSYSASLVLKLAGDDPGICDGVLAFSPGEYFSDSTLVARSAAAISVPVFIASGPWEEDYWRPIYDVIPRELTTLYYPSKEGRHGASALWPSVVGSQGYWREVEKFLKPFLKTK